MQVIANPFQAGILRLCHSPYQIDAWANCFDRLTSLTAASQLPGVELDLAESTSCILKVPFIHPLNYFTVVPQSTIEDMGKISVFAYTPAVLAVGASSPTVALWQWLEDFELIGAAPAEYTAQSGISARGKSTSSKEAEVVPANISNILSAGAKFTTWAGTKIPMLSAYAGPTSWFLRQTAHIAASYGWSKPLVVQPITKMVNTSNAYQNNSDGADPSFNLGLFSDNAVAVLPGFAGSSIDEMSFDYIKGVYAAVTIGSLTTTDVPSSISRSITLSPNSLYYSPTNLSNLSLAFPNVNSGKSFWPSPLMALGNCFEKWRGGIKFRVKIAKTKFHTGRLILGFCPHFASTASYVPTDPINMQYKSIVWDLREGNCVEFECPFTNNESYLSFDQNYGTFFISVLDPLDGPTTVSQVVNYVVEVAGMNDFEFAQPRNPVFPLAPIDTRYTAQSGLSSVLNVSPDSTPSLLCIGEKVNSVKQMVSRACAVAGISLSGAGVYEPLLNSPYWSPTAAAPTSLTLIDNSYLNYFQSFYKISRGGYHLHLLPVGINVTMAAHLSANNSLSSTSMVLESNCPLHVKVPYYNYRSRDIVGDSVTSFSATNFVSYTVSKATGSNAKVIVSSRAAEDYQLGYFVGAPPLSIPFTANTLLDDLLESYLTTNH